MVLLELEEALDVGVPRLEVHRERALPLAAALVDVARRVVEDAEHRHQPVRRAARPLDVRARRADHRRRHTDPARRLGDASTEREGVEDAWWRKRSNFQ